MKKGIRLYNVIFPFWMLILLPVTWLIAIPANFAIDSLVLIIAMHILKMKNKALIYQKCILKVFLFGFLADIIGAGLLFLALYFNWSTMGDELYLTIPALIISGVLIFVFDYFFSFKKISKENRFKLALTFAIATAPYTFLIPTEWMY